VFFIWVQVGQHGLDARVVTGLAQVRLLGAFPGEVAGLIKQEALFVFAVFAGADEPQGHGESLLG
jgi:hypothetical protein